jgi:hypothetical protein
MRNTQRAIIYYFFIFSLFIFLVKLNTSQTHNVDGIENSSFIKIMPENITVLKSSIKIRPKIWRWKNSFYERKRVAVC